MEPSMTDRTVTQFRFNNDGAMVTTVRDNTWNSNLYLEYSFETRTPFTFKPEKYVNNIEQKNYLGRLD